MLPYIPDYHLFLREAVQTATLDCRHNNSIYVACVTRQNRGLLLARQFTPTQGELTRKIKCHREPVIMSWFCVTDWYIEMYHCCHFTTTDFLSASLGLQ